MSRVEDEYWERYTRHKHWKKIQELEERVKFLETRIEMLAKIQGIQNKFFAGSPFSSAHQTEKKSH